MEKQVGIWIDSKKAIIVSLDGQKEEKITEIDSEVENKIYHNKESNKGTFSGRLHSNNETKFENRKKEELNYYLKSVINHINKPDYLYIFGPGLTKTKLEQKIHDEKLLGKTNLKAVETSGNMTLNEIVSQIKDFYNPLQRKINLAHRL